MTDLVRRGTRLILALAIGTAVAIPAWGGASRADSLAARERLLTARRERLRKKWEKQFRAADRDQNRELSRDELRKADLPRALITHFAQIDTDHDGELSPDELMAMYDKRLRAQAPRRPSKAAADARREMK